MNEKAKKVFKECPLTFKAIGQILVVSVSLLSVLLGINSDILSQYDSASHNEFEWWNPRDVLEFPVRQIRYNEGTPTKHLEFNETDPENLHFVFLLDRTKSGLQSPGCGDCLKQRSELVDYISSEFGEQGPQVDTLDFQTLMCLTMIKYIKNEINNDQAKVKITITYHDGLKDKLIWVGKEKGRVITMKEDFAGIIDDVAKSQKNEQHVETTYFDCIYSQLSRELNRSDNKEYAKTILTTISDFGHDKTDSENHSYSQIEKALAELSKSNIQMNLIKFPLKSDQKESYKPEELISLLRFKFKDTYLYHFDIDSFYNQYDTKELRLGKIKEFVTPTATISGKPIFLVYPDIEKKVNARMMAASHLKLAAQDEEEDIFVTPIHQWGPMNSYIEYAKYPYQGKKPLQREISERVQLRNGESLKIMVQGGDFREKLQLDIYSESKNKKNRYDIHFVEKTSLTVAQIHTSLVLISFFCILSVAFFLLRILLEPVRFGFIVTVLAASYVYVISPVFELDKPFLIALILQHVLLAFVIFWIYKYDEYKQTEEVGKTNDSGLADPQSS